MEKTGREKEESVVTSQVGKVDIVDIVDNCEETEKTESAPEGDEKAGWEELGNIKIGDSEEEPEDLERSSTEQERYPQIEHVLRSLSALEGERFMRRKNLFVRKGPNWEQGKKLKAWVEEKLTAWNFREEGFKLEQATQKESEKDKSMLLLFEKEEVKKEFWMRKRELKSEGKVVVDEDLCEEDRKARRQLRRKVMQLSEQGQYSWAENRYLVTQERGGDKKFMKWNGAIGFYKVGVPKEELEKWEWVREREEKLKKEREERLEKERGW